MPIDCAIIIVAIVFICIFALPPALAWLDERKNHHG